MSSPTATLNINTVQRFEQWLHVVGTLDYYCDYKDAKIKISIDADSDQLGQPYETLGFLGKLVECPRLLFINFISFYEFLGRFLFVQHSKMGRNIKQFRASHQALEIIYTYAWKKTKGKGIIDRLLTHILLNFSNGRAVRNRLKLVKNEVKRAALSLNRNFGKKEITIMSLGAGSARAIIEVLAELKAFHYPIRFTVILVDISKNALRYSERLAEEYGIADSVNWIRECGLLEEFIQNTHEHQPDIIEMVGVMDYFDKIASLDAISQIYDILNPQGTLITCNVRDNPEKLFLDRVLEWPMTYREPEELAEIMLSSGFDSQDVDIIYEPLLIHGVVVARKVPRLIKTKAY